jgi:hypothetical protein
MAVKAQLCVPGTGKRAYQYPSLTQTALFFVLHPTVRIFAFEPVGNPASNLAGDVTDGASPAHLSIDGERLFIQAQRAADPPSAGWYASCSYAPCFTVWEAPAMPPAIPRPLVSVVLVPYGH